MIQKVALSKRQFFLFNMPHPLVAFIVTAFALMALFAVSDIAPFGQNAFLISDLHTQHAPKMIAFKNHLLSEGALSYSFQNGMGKNVMGTFAYYLSSPFNIISFFFPSEMISHLVMLLVTIKLSLAGAFMAFFLETRSCKKDKSSILFALLYVFSSYIIINMIHIIWLDGLFWLPLLLAVIEKYIKNKEKWILLIVCFTILFLSGYYIAYMVGVFSFLYLLGRLIERKAFMSERIKETKKCILYFIIGAVLAAGISAWLILPAGWDTLRHLDYTGAPLTHTTLFLPTDILNQFFVGSIDDLSKNLPLLYSGIITIILNILFFLHPKISKRRKAVAGAALLFFFLSFIYSGLDYFWHLFSSPNWFLHRQSFLAVFVLVAIAYNTFTRRHEFSNKHYFQCGAIIFSALLFVSSFGDIQQDKERFFINLFFIAVTLALLWASTINSWPGAIKNLKKMAMPILVAVIIVELIFVNPLLVRAAAGLRMSTNNERFMAQYQQMLLLRDYANNNRSNNENNFYRMEVDRRTDDICNRIAGHYLDYSSVSTFDSVANKQVSRFLKQLGMRTSFNYFSTVHSYNMMPVDSFLGIEYIITSAENTAGYPRLLSAGNDDTSYNLFHNELAFPLIFPVRSDANTFDYYRLERNEHDKDYFSFQNDWMASLFNEFYDSNILYPAQTRGPVLGNAFVSDSTYSKESIYLPVYDRLGMESREGVHDIETTYLRVNNSDKMIFDYEIFVESTDPLYFCISTWQHSVGAEVFLADEELPYLSQGYFTEVFELGSFQPGEYVSVRIMMDEEIGLVGIIDAYAYHYDTELFRSIMGQTDVYSAAQNINVENGRVQAGLTLEEKALVLTTIPYERGWTLLVNDEKIDITPYQDTFISFPLDAGEYEIELNYRAPGLRAGICISVGSLLILVTVFCRKFLRRRRY